MWKKMTAAALMAALALSAAACSQQPADSDTSGEPSTSGEQVREKETVRIAALKGPTAMGMLKMMEEGEQGQTPDDYQFTLAGSPDELSAPILKGEFDIAAVPTNLAAVLYQKGEQQIQVAALNTLGVLYVVERGDTIQSVQDLAGRTVYNTSKGSVPEYAFNYIVEQSGLDPAQDMQVEYLSEHAEVAALLASGEADTAVLPQPFVTSVLTQNEQVRVALDLTQEWDKVGGGSSLTMGCVVVQKEFAQQHPEVVHDFLETYAASVEYVNGQDNLEQAAQLAEKYDIVKAAVAQKAIPACNIVCITGDEMQHKLDGFLQVLYDANPAAVGGSMPDEGFYYKN